MIHISRKKPKLTHTHMNHTKFFVCNFIQMWIICSDLETNGKTKKKSKCKQCTAIKLSTHNTNSNKNKSVWEQWTSTERETKTMVHDNGFSALKYQIWYTQTFEAAAEAAVTDRRSLSVSWQLYIYYINNTLGMTFDTDYFLSEEKT